MGTILLTTDLSEESKRSFAPTQELARKLGDKVVLLHVVHNVTSIPVAPVPGGAPVAVPAVTDFVVQARGQLEEFRRDLGEAVDVEVVTGGDVVEAITSHAEKIGASFIALSTHGRTGFRRLVMGSVAEGVLRHSSTPVVCYPQT